MALLSRSHFCPSFSFSVDLGCYSFCRMALPSRGMAYPGQQNPAYQWRPQPAVHPLPSRVHQWRGVPQTLPPTPPFTPSTWIVPPGMSAAAPFRVPLRRPPFAPTRPVAARRPSQWSAYPTHAVPPLGRDPAIDPASLGLALYPTGEPAPKRARHEESGMRERVCVIAAFAHPSSPIGNAPPPRGWTRSTQPSEWECDPPLVYSGVRAPRVGGGQGPQKNLYPLSWLRFKAFNEILT